MVCKVDEDWVLIECSCDTASLSSMHPNDKVESSIESEPTALVDIRDTGGILFYKLPTVSDTHDNSKDHCWIYTLSTLDCSPTNSSSLDRPQRSDEKSYNPLSEDLGILLKRHYHRRFMSFGERRFHISRKNGQTYVRNPYAFYSFDSAWPEFVPISKS